MKKRRKSSFTLIEILAVIALLSVLISIFAPAFSRMMFGSKVDQMASNFKTGMEMAQAKAVATRKYVAMIIPGNYAAITDPRLKPYCNGGYRLAFVKKNGEKWLFNGWLPGSSWTNIADGAMLTGIQKSKDWLDSNKKLKDLPDPVLATSTVFSGYDELTLIDANGFDDGDTKDTDVKALYSSTEASSNLKGLIFTPYGGRVGSSEPHIFFFTEARVNGGNYEYPNEDNFVMLKLNSITGKVVYLPTEDGE